MSKVAQNILLELLTLAVPRGNFNVLLVYVVWQTKYHTPPTPSRAVVWDGGGGGGAGGGGGGGGVYLVCQKNTIVKRVNLKCIISYPMSAKSLSASDNPRGGR